MDDKCKIHKGRQKIVDTVQSAIDKQGEQERKANAYRGLTMTLRQIWMALALMPPNEQTRCIIDGIKTTLEELGEI